MRALGGRLASERGSVIIEVLVGTILLALTTTAVLNGLDGAQDTGRRNKDRSVSSTLAQQDLERMRSMPATALVNLDQTRTVTIADVPYTVRSVTESVRDASGVVSCTTDDTEAEYLKLSSTVTAAANPNAPVTATSLLAPPVGSFGDTGTATVKLTDRDGQPLKSVNVDLDGPSSLSAQTNDVGCAVFAFIDADDWTAEVDGGLVTWSGETPATSAITVAPGKTSLTQIELDRPGSLRASFVTPAGVASQARSISVANAKLPNGFKPFPVGTAAATKDASNLFPFRDGYGVFAGSCEANNPALWVSNYFQASGFGFAELDPGELLQPVQVVVPELRVTVRRGSGSTFTGFANVRIYVKEIDTALDCDAVVYNSGEVPGSHTSAGYVFTVPVPFGNYQVCAAVRQTSGSSWQRSFTGTTGLPANRNLTQPPLSQDVAMDVPTTAGNGECNSPVT